MIILQHLHYHPSTETPAAPRENDIVLECDHLHISRHSLLYIFPYTPYKYVYMSILQQLGKGLSTVLNESLSIPSGPKFGGMNLFYPIDITTVEDRPLLQLTCKIPVQGYTNIYFPMPEGVQMNDGMSYNNQDLNLLGFAAQQATRVGTSATSIKDAIAKIGGDNALEKLNGIMPKNRSETAMILSEALIDDPEIKAGIASVTQMSLNKNTVTTFDGVSTRTHSFSFKMIARSPEEAEVIRNIHFVLRSGMYPVDLPGKQNMALSFPPKWGIRFVSLPHMRDLPHLPQPYECYLQNLSTNFNASSKMWRNDKAPLEVDITVAFMETKALTMRDIAFLQGNFSADGSNRGENNTLGAQAINNTVSPRGLPGWDDFFNRNIGRDAGVSPPGSVGSSGSGQGGVNLFNPNNDGMIPANGSLPTIYMNKEGTGFLP